MRAASIYFRGMFNTEDYTVPEQDVLYKKDLVTGNEDVLTKTLFNSMTMSDMVIEKLIVCDQVYSKGDLVPLAMKDSDNMEVGIILAILIHNGTPFFICKQFHCVRHFLQYFEKESCVETIRSIRYDQIADYKPLVRRGTVEEFLFVLHHRISVIND